MRFRRFGNDFVRYDAHPPAAKILGHLMPTFLALDETDRRLTPDERAVVDAYLAGAIAAIERIL